MNRIIITTFTNKNNGDGQNMEAYIDTHWLSVQSIKH